MKNHSIRVITLTITMLLAATLPGAAGQCDLAHEVAGKAAEAFSQDKSRGLRLFIKARQLCPDDAALAYNLGMAYYRYGRRAEAIDALEKAVALDGSNSRWLNNLATLLIDSGQNPARALGYAERAVKAGDSAAARDTLAKAQLANGQGVQALRTIRQAKSKWPSDQALGKSHAAILDSVLAGYLRQIKDGRTQDGLAGLKKLDDEPQAARAYCLALARLGRFEQAMTAAEQARARFTGEAAIRQVQDDIVDQTARSLYVLFQSGQSAKAVQDAKHLADSYPRQAKLKKAYDELFEAFLADAATIQVPSAGQVARTAAGPGGRADALLNDLGGGAQNVALDLTVDVDTEIPRGRLQRPNAVAVVIGNQRYKKQGKGINDVIYAGRDAAVMKKYLEQVMGFAPRNIIYRLDATNGDLCSIFGSKDNPRGMLHNYVRSGESEVFVYYVGHGAPGPQGNSAYLVPVDAEVDYIANNGYSLDLFYTVLKKLPARHLTVVLDACFSGDSGGGPLFKKISPAMLKNVQPLQKLAHSVVFSSAAKDQVSTWYPAKRHSLFTYFFLKGLGGAADKDGNKRITAGEMQAYLVKEVPYWARREANREQTPLVAGEDGAVLAQLR